MTGFMDRARRMIESGEVDPHLIARETLKGMSDREVREAVAEALPELIRHELGARRVPPPAPGAPRSSRWEQAREAWLSSAYCVDGTWKSLGNCTVEDVRQIAADYDRRAQENAALASRFSLLAAQMTAAGARLVSDLQLAALPEAA